jgi:pimeloyl-ACP methyl ester carboxylesterase
MENQAVMTIDTIKVGRKTIQNYTPVTLLSDKGGVHTRYYHSPSARESVIFIGGIDGDFDSPANNLYHRLARELIMHRISSLRIQYRNPENILQSVLDVVGGIRFLQSFGIEDVAIVGHSFGGAVAIQAAANNESVKSIVTLATQSYGANVISHLSQTSILLLHGQDDAILSVANSEYIHELAQGPKGIITYPATGHRLNESATSVHTDVKSWLLRQLK